MKNNGFVSILLTAGIVLILAALLSINSCLGNLSSTPNYGGFFVFTTQTFYDPLFGTYDTIPMPRQLVNGSWDGTYTGGTPYGSVLTFPDGGGYARTDDTGTGFELDGLINAYWNFGAQWSQPCGPTATQYFVQLHWAITQAFPWIDIDCGPVPSAPASGTMNPQFGIEGSTPSTVNVTGSNLTTSSGLPLLYIWDYGSSSVQPPPLISKSGATSVSQDATTATFNFPKYNGGAVPAGIYKFGLYNQLSGGGLQNVSHGLFSIGTNSTAYSSPFGVDIGNVKVEIKCQEQGEQGACNGYPQTTNTLYPYVTLYNSAKMTSGYAGTFNVGNQPTAVKLFGTSITNSGGCEPQQAPWVCITTWWTQPAYALVTNTGSNTVSVLDLVNGGSLATISVGSQPLALFLGPLGSPRYAYVANYGGGTVSQVNLTTDSVTGTVTVGSNPMALALDPSGTSFWVGGLNYISQVSTSNLSVLRTYSVSGQVTSLVIAGQQDALMYTVVSGSNFQVSQSKLSTGAFVQRYAQTPTANYSCQGCNTTPLALLASGMIVSTNYSNNGIVAATPTGFVVLDLSSKKVVMQGSTATPIRSIATDPNQGTVYMTVPGSNSLINAPLPPIAK
jgi:YVTN family beta-propeller protein